LDNWKLFRRKLSSHLIYINSKSGIKFATLESPAETHSAVFSKEYIKAAEKITEELFVWKLEAGLVLKFDTSGHHVGPLTWWTKFGSIQRNYRIDWKLSFTDDILRYLIFNESNITTAIESELSFESSFLDFKSFTLPTLVAPHDSFTSIYRFDTYYLFHDNITSSFLTCGSAQKRFSFGATLIHLHGLFGSPFTFPFV